MDRAVIKEAARLADRHENYVMAMIVGSEGSTPRKIGGAMILRGDGTFFGSIGGATFEEEVKSLMRDTKRSHRGGLHHFNLRGWKEGGTKSRCGGSVEVAIQYVDGGPNVLICGGGHTGMALARVLTVLGYDHSVADDRPDYATRERFPAARDLLIGSPEEIARSVSNDGVNFTHIYLLGYDAQKDEDLMAGILPGYGGHVGLIASRTKRGLTLKSLKKRGISDAVLKRVRSPVGLKIGAITPEEIAVSVAAEVIMDSRASVVD